MLFVAILGRQNFGPLMNLQKDCVFKALVTSHAQIAFFSKDLFFFQFNLTYSYARNLHDERGWF